MCIMFSKIIFYFLILMANKSSVSDFKNVKKLTTKK